MMNHYSLSHSVPCRYKAVRAAKKGESIWISKIFGTQRRRRMGREKKKKLLEKKKCDVGWSHRGKCEDSSRILDSEFAISRRQM